MKKFLVSIFIVAQLAGCSTTLPIEQTEQLKPGMSRAEVIAILGQPVKTSISNNTKTDIYIKTSINKTIAASCGLTAIMTAGIGLILCASATDKNEIKVTYTDDKLSSFNQ